MRRGEVRTRLMESSFMGGVTRTLNISYLKAVPVGEYPSPFQFLPFESDSWQFSDDCRHDNPYPQRSNPNRQNNGHDPRRDDQSR